MEESVFTKIVKGEIPCHKIFEDEKFFAFLDIYPANTGHTVFIPKEQTPNIWEMSEELYLEMWKTVKQLAPKLQRAMGTKKMVIRVEGFDVQHTHVLLIPADEYTDIKLQDFETEPDHPALAKVAEQIREALEN